MRSRITTDGTGRAFSSEHVYCSNFAPAQIRYDDNLYVSAEHAFQTAKAKANGYDQLALEMVSMVNPYYIKKIGNSLEVKDEWKENEQSVLEEIMRAKFEQNDRLRRKLVLDTCTKYYEMTNDRFWGTGARITSDVKTVDTSELQGKNITGEILNKLKEEFMQWDDSWSESSSINWIATEQPIDTVTPDGKRKVDQSETTGTVEE